MFHENICKAQLLPVCFQFSPFSEKKVPIKLTGMSSSPKMAFDRIIKYFKLMLIFTLRLKTSTLLGLDKETIKYYAPTSDTRR